MGRFITADPTVQHPTDPQDLNRYAYARNNPIKYNDPTGLSWFSKLIGAIVGVVVGAAVFIGTGSPILGIMAGVAAYRATDAALSGAKMREVATAGINGAGEGGAIAKDPGKISSLWTQDPQTDSVSKDGHRVMVAALQYFGMDQVSAELTSRQLESVLTKGNRSYAAIVGQAGGSNSVAADTWRSMGNILGTIGGIGSVIIGINILAGAAVAPSTVVAMAAVTVGAGLVLYGVGTATFSSSELMMRLVGADTQAIEPSFARKLAKCFTTNLSPATQKTVDRSVQGAELLLNWKSRGASVLSLDGFGALYDSTEAVKDSAMDIKQALQPKG